MPRTLQNASRGGKNKFNASGITEHASPSIRVCRKLLAPDPKPKACPTHPVPCPPLTISKCHFWAAKGGEKKGLNKMLLALLHCPDMEQAKPELGEPQTSHTGACCTSPGAKRLPPEPPALRRDIFLKPFRKRPLSLPFLRVLKNHYQQGEEKKKKSLLSFSKINMSSSQRSLYWFDFSHTLESNHDKGRHSSGYDPTFWLIKKLVKERFLSPESPGQEMSDFPRHVSRARGSSADPLHSQLPIYEPRWREGRPPRAVAPSTHTEPL